MTSKTTYTETIERFHIVKHDEMPEEHKAAMRAEGIDPDNFWTIAASAPTLAVAESTLAFCKASGFRWSTYKIVDHGEAKQIERPIW
jgi:hypothetical protein